MMLRNSERSSFKTCRHRWQWVYLEGRQSMEAPRALRFGDLVHQALANYNKVGTKRGTHPAKTFEVLYHKQALALKDQGFNVYSEDAWVDALDLGIGMLNGYVERFRDEDAEWEIVSTEQTFQLPVRIPAPGDLRPSLRKAGSSSPRWFRFKVVGTFDGVWRHRSNGRIVFKEYKTAASINLDGLPMDEQAGMYWTYGPKWLRSKGILADDEMPAAIMYTYLRKAIPDLSKARNAEGHILNKPSKDALREEYKRLQRRLPQGTGATGAVTVDDMMKDLPGAALLGEVSKVQPSPYFARVPVYRDTFDRQRVHARISAEVLDIARARAGLLSLYKNPGPLHMPNCRGCSVRDACEAHETGADYASILEQTMIPWNAYAAHELPERH